MTEDEAVHAESVGLALFVALETLTPAERLAFLLHDMFAVPYDEIAPIVGTSADTARRLASRARRRVRGMPDSADARGDRRGGERGPALDAGGSSVGVQLTAYESRSEGPGTSSHRQWD
jgi:hypothetical protein